MTHEHYGKHYLVDLKQCDPKTIEEVAITREIFLEAAREANATVMGELFHQFQPVGVSGVLLIAESHISVHTWPEDCFASVDIFTCGEEMDPEKAIEVLTRGFRAERVDVTVHERGRMSGAELDGAELDGARVR
jgi:S-adenosylmethionine decarboxylase